MARLPITVLLSASLAAAPVLAAAAPPDDASGDPLEAARLLYNEGQNCFDLADYLCAIEKWTDAYGKTPNEPEHVQIRVALLNNLATAREKAYELTNEVIHLKQARDLLERFKNNIDGLEMGEQDQAEQVARIDERLEAIDETLASLEQQAEADPPEPEPAPEGPTPTPEPTPTRDDPARDLHPGRPLIITGGVMLGLGAVAGGVSLAFTVISNDLNELEDGRLYSPQEREDLEDQGDAANRLAWASGITGIVLIGAGAALLGIGVRNNDRARSLSVAPYGGPSRAGISLSGRF